MKFEEIKSRIKNEYPDFTLNEDVWNYFEMFFNTFGFNFDKFDIFTFNDSLNRIYDLEISFQDDSVDPPLAVKVIFNKYGGLEIRVMRMTLYSTNVIIKPEEKKFHMNSSIIHEKKLYDMGFQRSGMKIDGEVNYFTDEEFNHHKGSSMNEHLEIDFDCQNEEMCYQRLFGMAHYYLENPELIKSIIKEGIKNERESVR